MIFEAAKSDKYSNWFEFIIEEYMNQNFQFYFYEIKRHYEPFISQKDTGRIQFNNGIM